METQPKSLYRNTLRAHILVLVTVIVFLAGLFGLHVDYDRKVRQYTELTGLAYLFDRVKAPLRIDLQNHSRRFLLDYYSELLAKINAHSVTAGKWEWASYDLDSKMIALIEHDYLSYEHYSIDDLRYLWNQDRVSLELPVVEFESLKLMIDRITTRFESRFSVTQAYMVRFDVEAFEPSTLSAVFRMSATFGSYSETEIVAVPIRMQRFTIDELNNLRMQIDGLYNSIYIVDDIANSFDHNFPSLASLPSSYQGLPPNQALNLAEKTIYKNYIKWSPPAEITVLLMCLICTLAYLCLRIPIVDISTTTQSPNCFIKGLILGMLPFGLTVVVSLYSFMTFKTYIVFGEWLFIISGTLVGLQGIVFGHRFGVYMCSSSENSKVSCEVN